MELEVPYVYKVLDKPDKTIRLIKTLSTDPIRCQFTVVPLKASPVFSALSYMWGNATETHSISIGDGTLLVSTNLAHALQDVHNQWSHGHAAIAEGDRWLWADAICINQNDNEEKNHQVPLMEDIYSRAQRIFSWLGIENEDTCEGLDAINQVAKEVSQLSCYADLTALTMHGSFFVPPSILPSEHVRRTWVLEWIGRHYNPRTLSESHVRDMNQLLLLFELPYWKRVWVLQEVVLAQDIILVSGANSTSWSAVCVAMLWIQLFKTVHPSIENAWDVFGNNWLPLTLYTVSEYVVRISSMKFHRAKRAKIAQQSSRQTPTGMDCALYHASVSYRATNPKDYVYGLNGMSGIRVNTDYSQETTVAQTYEELIAHCLLAFATRNDEAFWNGQPNRLWFLDLAGIGFAWQQLPGLASWAPNFVGVVDAGKDGSLFRFNGPNDRSSAGIFAYNTNTDAPWLENRILHCTAIFIDRISEVGPKIHGININQPSLDRDAQSDDWLLWIFDCVADSTEVAENSMDLFVRMARVLFYERIFGDVEPIQYFFDLLVRILLADLEHVCKKRRDMSCETFYNRLRLPPPDRVAEETRSSSSQVSKEDHRTRAVAEWSEGDMSRLGSAAATVGAYMDAQKQANGLLMAFTDSDLIGQFPPLVQTGDLVCILKGFSLPVILRKLDNGGYIHVGACYIPDLMDDDAEELLQHGENKWEEIDIK
jgi:hypothetical protein